MGAFRPWIECTTEYGKDWQRLLRRSGVSLRSDYPRGTLVDVLVRVVDCHQQVLGWAHGKVLHVKVEA